MYKNNVEIRKTARQRIRKRIRKKISGTSEKPRVMITRSNRYIYVQAIDDDNGKVLAAASTLEKEFKEKHKNTKNSKASQVLGDIVAKRLKKIKVEQVVFDRGIYPYHGRIKTLAEAMRKGGLVF